MERKKKDRISKEKQEIILNSFGIRMLPEDDPFAKKDLGDSTKEEKSK